MYKILAVDDEYMMLKGIEKIVSMYLNDFTVIGTCEDANSALDLMKNTVVDVLITDIRMPHMDGIELAGEARKLLPDLVILIATGFEELTYYQRAMKHGVFAYILKPYDIKEFLDIFSKIKNLLDHLNRQKKMLRNNMLDSLLANNYSDTQDIQFKSLQTELSDGQCMVLHIIIDDHQILENELGFSWYSNLKKNIVILGEKFFDMWKAIFFINSIGNITSIVIIKEKMDLLTAEKPCRDFVEFVSGTLFTSISIGMSCVYDIHDLSKAYIKAKENCLYNYYTGHGSVNAYFNNLVYDIAESTSLLMQFSEFLKANNYDDAIKIVERLVDTLLSVTPPPVIARKIMNQLLFLSTEHQNRFELQKSIIDQNIGNMLDDIQNSFDTLVGAKKWLLVTLSHLKDTALKKATPSMIKSIKTVLDYIDENYNKSINLNDAAELIFMHPVYLSKLFKKEVGTSFTEYYTNKKIEKAKEYLNNTMYKIKDIAFILGFPDEKYFYKVFKKFTGMTPNEFKNHDK